MSEHDHGQHDGDIYCVDQFCMVAISGAFGAICLAMYISKILAPADGFSMLGLLLGEQFHQFVLGSGIALVLVAIVRSVKFCRTALHTARGHRHDHGEQCQDHGDQHSHEWAPWRYVILMAPIILFLLGLPNNGPVSSASHVQVDSTRELAVYAGLVAGAQPNEGDVLSWIAGIYMTEEEGSDVQFKELADYANSPELRAEKQGKTVRVRGQVSRDLHNDRVFTLVRWRIRCCAADAIEVAVPIVTRESLTKTDFKLNDWVKVTGVVDFYQRFGGQYRTVLRVLNMSKIERCPPDNNPYIQ